MPLEDRIPEGWAVRLSPHQDGSLTVSVLIRFDGESDERFTKFEYDCAFSKRVPPIVSRWKFWEKSFEVRLEREIERAKKLAYDLNIRRDSARRIAYNAQQKANQVIHR